MTNESPELKASPDSSRRGFLKTSAAVGVAGAVSPMLARSVHASGSDVLKVGLIGCGGRGNGAAENAMQADKNAKLVALADLFPKRMDQAKSLLKRNLKDRFVADDDHCFTGIDAYKQLIDSGVDVVLLCSPPHFRPAHLEYAIQQNKHVFCEKPIATDIAGVKKVIEVARVAKEKNLNIVSGLCWRYDLGVQETIKRIKDGAIGEIINTQENYLTGTLWLRNREPGMTDLQYQMLNWMYYRWLSGDHIVEQFIHSLDKSLWLNNDEPPVAAYGIGGRQVRTAPEFGDVYDHFSVVYEWANGSRTFAHTRQMPGCFNEVEDFINGTKGSAKVLANTITGETKWKYEGPAPSMYDLEHNALFAAIRSGSPINNGTYMSYSTAMAILGREACYSGKRITWQELIDSNLTMGPASYDGEAPPVAVAVPGVYKI